MEAPVNPEAKSTRMQLPACMMMHQYAYGLTKFCMCECATGTASGMVCETCRDMYAEQKSAVTQELCCRVLLCGATCKKEGLGFRENAVQTVNTAVLQMQGGNAWRGCEL